MSKFEHYFKVGTKFRQYRYWIDCYKPDAILTLVRISPNNHCDSACHHAKLGDCPKVQLHFERDDDHRTTFGCPYIGYSSLRIHRIEDEDISGMLYILLNDLVSD